MTNVQVNIKKWEDDINNPNKIQIEKIEESKPVMINKEVFLDHLENEGKEE